MADITCSEAEALIGEVAALGCKSPWERELAKLALLNRIAGAAPAPSGAPQIYTGVGDPEGVLAAQSGSIYFDLTNPSAPVQWVKGSGSGNTGWI